MDSHLDCAESTALLLSLNGFATRAAYSEAEALQSAADFDPDVIVMDVGWWKLDGREIVPRLLPTGRPRLLVAVSCDCCDQVKEQSLAAGFQHFLVKPFNPVELLAVLKLGPLR